MALDLLQTPQGTVGRIIRFREKGLLLARLPPSMRLYQEMQHMVGERRKAQPRHGGCSLDFPVRISWYRAMPIYVSYIGSGPSLVGVHQVPGQEAGQKQGRGNICEENRGAEYIVVDYVVVAHFSTVHLVALQS